MGFDPVTVTRSYEQVVRQIVDGISSGRLVRGQKLPTERELSASFGVGRGVIREAVKVLGAMGLVEPRQGSGLYVRNDPLPSVSRALTLSVSPEAKAIGRLFEFRRTLEIESARRAAERRTSAQAVAIQDAAQETVQAAATDDGPRFWAGDVRFHAAVYTAADNPYLAATLGTIREIQSDVVHHFAGHSGSIAVAAGHHQRIAAAIAAGDGDTAAAVMDEHSGHGRAQRFWTNAWASPPSSPLDGPDRGPSPNGARGEDAAVKRD